MAKQRKQHQQPSKKKLLVKQKLSKVETEAADAKGSSHGKEKQPENPANAKPQLATKTTQQQLISADAAETEQTVYGLNNLGNTCFYNSALQVLVSVPALRDFCTQPQRRPQIRKGPIGAALQELVQTVYGHRIAVQAQNAKAAKLSRNEDSPVFCPSRLLAAVCKIASQFKGRQQQDSHELLRCLLDGLLAEERQAIADLKDEREEVPQSFTQALFGGELSSRVVCKECSHETVTLEPFYDLSLPIPASLPAVLQADNAKRKHKGKGPQGKGKACIEKPGESTAEQEQHKLTAKQRKKAEKDARKQAHQARRKQRKRGAEADEEEPFPQGSALGLEDVASSTATAASGNNAAPGEKAEPEFTAGDSSPGAGDQVLCGGTDTGSSLRFAQAATTSTRETVGGTEQLSSSEQSSDTTLQEATMAASGQERNDVISSSHSPSRSVPEATPITSSDTYVSRDAESLSMLAAEHTGFDTETGAVAAAVTSPDGHDGGAAEQLETMPRASGRQKREERQQRSVKALSEQMQSASLAPDAKSGNCSGERAASEDCVPDSSVEDVGSAPLLTDGDASDSTATGEKPLKKVPLPPTGVEEIAETDPSSAELAGGNSGSEGSQEAAATTAPGPLDKAQTEAAAKHEIRLLPSAAFRATGNPTDFAHDGPPAGSEDGLIAVPVLESIMQKLQLTGSGEQLEATEAAAACVSKLQEESGTGEEDGGMQQPGSMSAGDGSADVEHELGVSLTSKEKATLYDELDALQEEAMGLRDVSDTEADMSGTGASASSSKERVGGWGQADNDAESEGEEMGALGSLFVEVESGEAVGTVLTEPGDWINSEQQQATQEATLQGCLAAFFAREVVTWECPAETAAASKRLMLKQQAAPDGTPQPLKRRSVSFSEEAPRVKLIPGSAEQRGTNFVRALQGDRPFCRPLKHKGGCFLLNAYVDNISRDKLHLGLQGQDENDATQLPLRDVHAINSRIEFGSVPISPVEDPEDEEEQYRVRSQAQALLDCVADLVVHSGLQGAINLLAEGAQLQRLPSGTGSHSSALGSPSSGTDSLSRMGSETWRIIGSLPTGFGEGTWEYPPPRDDPQGLSPSRHRSPSTDVFVPADASAVNGARSSNPGAARPQLPSSFWARFAASHEPIPEASCEGSSDSTSASRADAPLPLTPHNSLNEGDPPGSSPGSSLGSSGQKESASGQRKKKKPQPPALETQNSFTITAEVPQSPFSNDPDGKLLSNGWEPSWPVQPIVGERDSSEAYCRIFCNDKSFKNRVLSLRSDPPAAESVSSLARRASSGGYYADSEDEDGDSNAASGDTSSCTTSSSTPGSARDNVPSPFAASEASTMSSSARDSASSMLAAASQSGGADSYSRRHNGPSPFEQDIAGKDRGFSSSFSRRDSAQDSPLSDQKDGGVGRRRSSRLPFEDPPLEPRGGHDSPDIFTRRDSQMGFPGLPGLPGLDEDFLNSVAPASPQSSSADRSPDPSPFAAPEVQGNGPGPSPSANPSQHSDESSSAHGQIGQSQPAQWAQRNGVHGNGAVSGANGSLSSERRSSTAERKGFGELPATGVNKATGNAVFWAGSKSLGISFVDDPPEEATGVLGHGASARSSSSSLRLPGGAESHDTKEPLQDRGADDEAVHPGQNGGVSLLSDMVLSDHTTEQHTTSPSGDGGKSVAVPATAAARAEHGRSLHSVVQEVVQETSAESPAGSSEATTAACPAENAQPVGSTSQGALAEPAAKSDRKAAASAQSMVPEGQPLGGTRGGSGQSLQRSVSGKSILRKSMTVSVKREAVKGYLIHRAPEVLTLHLKRFQQDMRGRLRKIKGGVAFPPELDLTPFVDPKGKETGSVQYTLVGVVEHQGSMVSGHYISYSARCPPDDQAPPQQQQQQPPSQEADSEPGDAQPQQPQPRQGSSDLDDAVPLAPAHKANGSRGGAAKSGAAKPRTGSPAGPPPTTAGGPPEPSPAEAPAPDSATNGGGGGSAETRSRGEAPPPLLAGCRRELDPAKLQWFRASDSHVQRVMWDAVAACEPYILMYVRVR